MKDRVFAALTPLSAGSMRFRFDEYNKNRSSFFSFPCFGHKKHTAVELIHSHEVFCAGADDVVYGRFGEKQGDGIITCSASVLPVITVADCMPIFIYEPKSSCIGVLHSGWKGTGIVLKAFEKAQKEYGADIGNFRVILGPHIRSCCYTVDERRARFFETEFSPDCVVPLSEHNYAENERPFPCAAASDSTSGTPLYRLSLEKANLALLKKAGIKDEHILCIGECTCCTKNACGVYKYGSFRRETAALPESMSLEKKQRHFTPMAAFIGFKDDCFTPENLSEKGACIFYFDCGKIGV
ncbi:polyphenol oxidase family protein [Treponema sp. OMZ 840]|uniref:polyphenol oxidase family protein n=1 Tax=Treponema sp. OMZ 840 TaxID=244313 RepID=UPI003D89ECBA